MDRLHGKIFSEDWALVTAGNENNFNSMTISWGGIGTIWNKPVATIYVKPIRYTYQFLENNEYFTVSFYDQKYKKDLGILGSQSGRDGNKVALTTLTPEAIENSMTFKEARITLLCRKIYSQDLDVSNMEQPVIDTYYQKEAAHRMYIGEVIQIIEK